MNKQEKIAHIRKHVMPNIQKDVQKMIADIENNLGTRLPTSGKTTAQVDQEVIDIMDNAGLLDFLMMCK